MAMRVIAIPDRDGLIRVSCGNDILEIQVVTGTVASSPPPGGPFDVPTSPFNKPFNNPFNLPGAYINAPGGKGGNVDFPELVRKILEQTENPALPDPTGVVLNSDNANLHDVSKLGKSIAEAAPNLSFVLDFGGSWKP